MLALEAPSGVVLTLRSDPGVSAVGAMLLLRTGLDVFDLVGDAFPGFMEKLRDHYRARVARGEAPAVVVAETESEWADAVRGARAAATRDGIIDLVLGGGEAAFGTYLLLANAGVADFGRREQTAWGAVLVWVGLGGIAGGLWDFVGTSGVERNWAFYQSAKSGPVASARPRFGIAPAPHGAVTTLRLDF
jgi:hypothetical protein